MEYFKVAIDYGIEVVVRTEIEGVNITPSMIRLMDAEGKSELILWGSVKGLSMERYKIPYKLEPKK